MPNYNSPRYYRWYAQQQTDLTTFLNTTGTWDDTGAQLIRLDANSVERSRVAPYSRFPVLTGTRSEVNGIRGRKSATFSMRGIPIIPSGTAGTVPDLDILFQNAFGAAATVVAVTSATYNLVGTGFLPFSMLGFTHGSTTLTSQALFGCVITRVTFNFNQLFLTMDVDGEAVNLIDSAGFASIDTVGKGALTSFPLEPGSATVVGQPIAGFGDGYLATLGGNDIVLKTRTRRIIWETGLELVKDVEGSAYPVAVVGGTRRFSLELTALDDDSAALNSIKSSCDSDSASLQLVTTSGTVAGSKVQFTLNHIQPNAFNLRDNGNLVDFELPSSFAHATTLGAEDDAILAFK